MFSISLSGTAYELAKAIAQFNPFEAIIAIAMYAVFFILGIVYAIKPIKRSYKNHKELKKDVMELKQELEKKITYSKIEDLQLHISELKLIIDSSKSKIRKNTSLGDHYESVFSRIYSTSMEIEAELNRERTET